MISKNWKFAFTLAEVLIVITIIGVVAAMTLPTLLDVNQEKVWNTSAEVFETKMYQALKMMNIKGELARLDSTEDFVANLQKNMKIAKTCDNEHLDECFTKKISLMQGKKATKPKNLSGDGGYNLTGSENLGHADWETNVMGLQFTNGITALLAYNASDCAPTTNSQDNLTSCIAMIYDVNANGDPNTVKQDIRTMNAPVLGTNCADSVEIDGTSYCIAYVIPDENGIDCTDVSNVPTCNLVSLCKYGSDCSVDAKQHNKLAYAAKQCEDLGMNLIDSGTLSKVVTALGHDTFANLSKEYGRLKFAAKNWVTCNFNRCGACYNVSTANFGTGISVEGNDFVGVCIKAESY